MMKKFIYTLLIFLCLNFNIVKAEPQIQTNIFNQGVYKVENIIKVLGGDLSSIQNISSDKSIYFLLVDENQSVIQALKIEPNSAKYELHKLKPNYKIILIGEGSAFLS
ncbi:MULTISPECIES: hypothetical protein [unclassified Clostridium]|uniref:hypothetical protein n=1 Tax=unclassified Clostridium TaxID=2614128 RepID=UPI001FADB46A|nr:MULTISPECIES: hypothetical protein [unclassified Clostridium]